MSSILVKQAFNVLIMFYGGMTIMMFHQIFSFYQNKWKPHKAIAFVQDLLFWILAGLLASAFLYYCSYGRISFHAIGAMAAGGLFWKILLGRKISIFIGQLYDIITTGVNKR